MSDIEEPPAKVIKFEELDDEEEAMDEGQEEWLSEDILTDDDYNPGSRAELEQNDSNMAVAQDDTTPSIDSTQPDAYHNDAATPDLPDVPDNPNVPDVKGDMENIEEQLNNMNSTKNGSELPDDLDAFLIKKQDSKALAKNSATKPEDKNDDDGNDTDDLLRMLEEDVDKKKKKLTKTVKDLKQEKQLPAPPSSDDDDDDEFIYAGAKVKTLKVAKNAVIRKPPRAEPEDMSDDDTDASTEADMVSNMFLKKGPAPQRPAILKKMAPARKNGQSAHTVLKSSNPKHYVNKNAQQKSILKASTPSRPSTKQTKPEVTFKSETVKVSQKNVPKKDAKNISFNKLVKVKENYDEEFLENDGFEFDEEGLDSDGDSRLMRPETMDEEPPSDEDSHSEDGSLYDEIPSSDSEDLDDWFQLDVRAERAGDYLPLLGSKAKELLLEEKHRVSARLDTLKESLCALTDSGRKQADQLREATITLAELDDLLKAS